MLKNIISKIGFVFICSCLTLCFLHCISNFENANKIEKELKAEKIEENNEIFIDKSWETSVLIDSYINSLPETFSREEKFNFMCSVITSLQNQYLIENVWCDQVNNTIFYSFKNNGIQEKISF